MKVWIYKVDGDYDEGDEVRKIFDTKEKAEKWHKQMEELDELHQHYHREGGEVHKYGKGTSGCPEIIAIRKEACCKEIGNDGYSGRIMEMEVE